MDGLLIAERGCIYEWENIDNDRHKNLCLVVSAPRRSRDNLISVLFLTTDRGNYSDDVVRFKFNKQTWVIRADLVTYTPRKYLVYKVGSVAKEKMEEIDKKVMRSLGFEQSVDWKKMYDNLLAEVVRRD